MSVFTVYVRHDSNRSLPVDVDSRWHVGKLKEILSERLNLSARKNIRILFAGRELKDSFILSECCVQANSTLHVVCSTFSSDKSSPALDETGFRSLDVQLQRGTDSPNPTEATRKGRKNLPCFYVYCKTKCRDMTTGKLRVRCQDCKQATLTVSQDPRCWDDILHSGRIKGVCERESCEGNIAEFYFKCGAHSLPEEEDDTAVVLPRVWPNLVEVPCITCLNVSNPVFVFTCDPGHAMCLHCFRDYGTIQLNCRQFVHHNELGYTLQCPAGCVNSLVRESHHFRILGEEQYERYQRFGAEECLLQMGGVLCPGQDCGAGILSEDTYARKIKCVQGCGMVFCRDCLEPYHSGQCHRDRQSLEPSEDDLYSVSPLAAEKACWDKLSWETIHLTTRPCPACRVPVEKDGGCMHMVCARPQCKFNWCWSCGVEWNRTCQADHWFGQ